MPQAKNPRDTFREALDTLESKLAYPMKLMEPVGDLLMKGYETSKRWLISKDETAKRPVRTVRTTRPVSKSRKVSK